MARYKIAFAAAVGAASLVLSAGSSSALTNPELERQSACSALASDPDAVATYDPGANPNPQDDSCTVVSTASTVTEAIAQVNNPRAAKAVNRVVSTATTVTTTQEYRWQVGQNAGWVEFGAPVTEEEAEIISQCMVTPGALICQ